MAWTGTDNNTGSASRGGPNLLGAKLTMTYDNTVLDTETSTALDNVEEALEDLQDEVFEDMEEFSLKKKHLLLTKNHNLKWRCQWRWKHLHLQKNLLKNFYGDR